MNGDEQLLNGRVHGAEHDGPNPGPLPHRTYTELVGGPLDGLLPDIHRWRAEEVDDGVALTTGLSRWPGGPAAAPWTTRTPASPAQPAPENSHTARSRPGFAVPCAAAVADHTP